MCIMRVDQLHCTSSHLFHCMLHNRLGFLGSIDANTGSPDLGWDTDQFPMDVKNATLVMKVCAHACHIV